MTETAVLSSSDHQQTDPLTLWRQDLRLLWQRWLSSPADEQEWLVEDFVMRAEAIPGKIEALLSLAGEEFETIESMGWLEDDPPLWPDPASENLPSLAGLMPESTLYQRRHAVTRLILLCQTHLDTLWLEGAQA